MGVHNKPIILPDLSSSRRSRKKRLDTRPLVYCRTARRRAKRQEMKSDRREGTNQNTPKTTNRTTQTTREDNPQVEPIIFLKLPRHPHTSGPQLPVECDHQHANHSRHELPWLEDLVPHSSNEALINRTAVQEEWCPCRRARTLSRGMNFSPQCRSLCTTMTHAQRLASSRTLASLLFTWTR